MTCVVGMVKDGVVYMGADKQSSGSYGSIREAFRELREIL